MKNTTATVCDVRYVGARIFSFGDWRRLLRGIGSHAVMALGAVAAVGVLVATVTFAAAWIVNSFVATNPAIHASAPTGPGTLALVQDTPDFASAPAVTFADRWPRTTATMQASAMPLMPRHPATIADNVPLPPPRPLQVPHRQPQPEIAFGHGLLQVAKLTAAPASAPPTVTLAPLGRAVAQVAAAMPPPATAKRIAPLQEAHNKTLALPGPDSRTAVYDIAARTVYLPNGQKLEAHSGLGDKMDDPRYVKVRMHGPTPPNVYNLTLREEIFHGVRAIRLNPVDDDKMYGRAGMLAHTYMLGPNGQSNGCVSFRDYDKFLHAFLKGEVDRLVVVADLGNKPSLIGRARRGRDTRYAAND
jgi:Tlde1 domain